MLHQPIAAHDFSRETAPCLEHIWAGNVSSKQTWQAPIYYSDYGSVDSCQPTPWTVRPEKKFGSDRTIPEGDVKEMKEHTFVVKRAWPEEVYAPLELGVAKKMSEAKRERRIGKASMAAGEGVDRGAVFSVLGHRSEYRDKPAFLKSDMFRAIEIKDGTLTVDGIDRIVRWGKDTPADCMGKIMSVEPILNGKVTLADGVSCALLWVCRPNPALKGQHCSRSITNPT